MATWVLRIDFLLITLLLVFIAWEDILLRLISHRTLLILLGLLIPFILLQHKMPNFAAAGTVLLSGFLFFSLGAIGGGDVKLLTVLSLSMNSHILVNFFITMAFWGGFVVLIGLIFFRTAIRQSGVPYAVPISLAFLFTYPISLLTF
ncbi:A24 family peptidase [Intestinirhabdus alba]|jgi:prepilin peptidase CpaA|nr:prepilin peptidase [Intestinirhabdus alba]